MIKALKDLELDVFSYYPHLRKFYNESIQLNKTEKVQLSKEAEEYVKSLEEKEKKQ